MKPLLVVLFFFLLQHSAMAQDADSSAAKLTCKDAHEGMFDVLYQNMKFRVKREGDFQYEYTSVGFIKYKINWTSDCVYDLQVIETNIEDAKGYIGDHSTTTITIDGDKINYSCIYEKGQTEMRGYMKKVSE